MASALLLTPGKPPLQPTARCLLQRTQAISHGSLIQRVEIRHELTQPSLDCTDDLGARLPPWPRGA